VWIAAGAAVGMADDDAAAAAAAAAKPRWGKTRATMTPPLPDGPRLLLVDMDAQPALAAELDRQMRWSPDEPVILRYAGEDAQDG